MTPLQHEQPHTVITNWQVRIMLFSTKQCNLLGLVQQITLHHWCAFVLGKGDIQYRTPKDNRSKQDISQVTGHRTKRTPGFKQFKKQKQKISYQYWCLVPLRPLLHLTAWPAWVQLVYEYWISPVPTHLIILVFL